MGSGHGHGNVDSGNLRCGRGGHLVTEVGGERKRVASNVRKSGQ